MRSTIPQQISQLTAVLIFMTVSSQAFSFGAGFGSTNSGGSSTANSVAGCSSIGGATSGGSFGAGFTNISGTGGESCVGEDSDADRMSNTWELTNSLNKNLATDAYGDADSDGASNQREAAMGSLPKGTGTACPGFSTTTVTDFDCDGVTDGDDPDPDNASVTTLTVNGNYKGKKTTGAQLRN